MLKLPNGKPIDEGLLEIALADDETGSSYFLNVETGAIAWFTSDGEIEEHMEPVQDVSFDEVINNPTYVRIESNLIPSHEKYKWMEKFVWTVVEPVDKQVAEKLSNELEKRKPFRHFKDALNEVDSKWPEAWYKWEEDCHTKALQEWIDDVAAKNV